MSQLQTPPLMAPEAPQPDTSVRDFTKMWTDIGSDPDYMMERGHFDTWKYGEDHGLPRVITGGDEEAKAHAKDHADVYEKWLSKNHPELGDEGIKQSRGLVEREVFDRTRAQLLRERVNSVRELESRGPEVFRPALMKEAIDWLPGVRWGPRLAQAKTWKEAGERFQKDQAEGKDYFSHAIKIVQEEREAAEQQKGGWGQAIKGQAKELIPGAGELVLSAPGGALGKGAELGSKLVGNLPVVGKLAGALGAGSVATALNPAPALYGKYQRETPKVSINERGGLEVEGGQSTPTAAATKALASEWIDNSAMMLAGPWLKGRGKGALNMLFKSAQAGPTGLAAVESSAELKKALGLAPEGSDFRNLSSDDPAVKAAAWKRIVAQVGAFSVMHGTHEALGVAKGKLEGSDVAPLTKGEEAAIAAQKTIEGMQKYRDDQLRNGRKVDPDELSQYAYQGLEPTKSPGEIKPAEEQRPLPLAGEEPLPFPPEPEKPLDLRNDRLREPLQPGAKPLLPYDLKPEQIDAQRQEKARPLPATPEEAQAELYKLQKEHADDVAQRESAAQRSGGNPAPVRSQIREHLHQGFTDGQALHAPADVAEPSARQAEAPADAGGPAADAVRGEAAGDKLRPRAKAAWAAREEVGDIIEKAKSNGWDVDELHQRADEWKAKLKDEHDQLAVADQALDFAKEHLGQSVVNKISRQEKGFEDWASVPGIDDIAKEIANSRQFAGVLDPDDAPESLMNLIRAGKSETPTNRNAFERALEDMGELHSFSKEEADAIKSEIQRQKRSGRRAESAEGLISRSERAVKAEVDSEQEAAAQGKVPLDPTGSYPASWDEPSEPAGRKPGAGREAIEAQLKAEGVKEGSDLWDKEINKRTQQAEAEERMVPQQNTGKTEGEGRSERMAEAAGRRAGPVGRFLSEESGGFSHGEFFSNAAEVAKSLFRSAFDLRSPEEEKARGVIRHMNAKRVARLDQDAASFDKARRYFETWIDADRDPQSQKDKFGKFFGAIESGKIGSLPKELREFAKTYKEVKSEYTDMLARRGIIDPHIENHVGHLWKDPRNPKATPEDIAASLRSRRPMAGREGFKKQRVLESFADGFKAGLEPIDNNPARYAMLEFDQYNKSIFGHDVFNKLKKAGLVKFVGLGKNGHEGWQTIPDEKLMRVLVPQEGKLPGLAGEYRMPEEVARLLTNHLGDGFGKNAGYRLWRGIGNQLSQFLLGISAFHGTFTSLVSQFGTAAEAFHEATRGDLGEAIKKVPGALVPFWESVRALLPDSTARQLRAEHDKPGSQSPEIQEMHKWLMEGGGRVRGGQEYVGSQVEKTRTAFKKLLGGDLGAGAEAGVRAPFALNQMLSKPIMEHLVPLLKIQGFADAARYEMAKSPNMGLAERRQAMGKLWDAMDNRLGQLTYDNLFWNRKVRDSAQALMLSAGWNIGDVGVAKGGLEALKPQTWKDVAAGKGMSRNVAFIGSMVAGTAVMGALYQYVTTGKGPDDIHDLFFPKDGGINPDGSPSRKSLPTYVRDYAALLHGTGDNPLQLLPNITETLKGKLNPLVKTAYELMSNQDYRGKPIWNKNDSGGKQVQDMALHAVGAAAPISVKQGAKQWGEGRGVGSIAQSFVGITPAPWRETRIKEIEDYRSQLKDVTDKRNKFRYDHPGEEFADERKFKILHAVADKIHGLDHQIKGDRHDGRRWVKGSPPPQERIEALKQRQLDLARAALQRSADTSKPR